MKNWERFIVYPFMTLAVIYSIWARGKLNLLYRINRQTSIPAYEALPGRSFYVDSTGLYQLCSALGSLEISATLKSPSLSEGTRSLITGYLRTNIFFLNRWPIAAYLEDARLSLISATQAEIDLLTYEGQNRERLKNGAWYSDDEYMRRMNKSMAFRSEASFEIYRQMGKM